MAASLAVAGCAGSVAAENEPSEASSTETTRGISPAVEQVSTSTQGEGDTAPPAESTDAPAVVTTRDKSTKIERPSYNHGEGFFVLDGKLYDANGNEFRLRGVNKVHWDAWSEGLTNAKSNATRWTVDFTRDPEKNVALLQGAAGNGGTIAKGSVVIPGNWDGTCKDDPALLKRIVDTWVAQVASWNKLEKYMILNIANEWGPGDGKVWRDAYIEAITRLRAAGYHATISVTAGGCGQDPNAIVEFGKAVFDADPEHNVIFDQHIYGVYRDVEGGVAGQYDDQPDLAEHARALADTGLVVMLGEFGPGRDVGPSPTEIDPLRVIELAEKNHLGWLAWAWDDNNLANGVSDDHGFGMSIRGGYQSSSDLTEFGRAVVEHPTWGLKALARPATIFATQQ
ncbi:MAG TPA: cellulase family glycosylhydrolase [Polyangiales bacterium]